MTDRDTPPKYNMAIVEAVILEVAAELHPEHLSTDGLSLKIVSDPDDSRETETGPRRSAAFESSACSKTETMRSWSRHPAALRAVALLT